jgi:hypothetical protein
MSARVNRVEAQGNGAILNRISPKAPPDARIADSGSL